VTATFAVTEIDQIYQTNSIHTFLAPEQRAAPRVNVSPDNESKEEQIIMQGTVKESNHTIPLKELLVDELRDLLHAEGQLVQALPKMADAAHHPKLKEAFQKHFKQTGGHVERLKHAFELLGEDAQPKPCKAMMGLIEEGKETIKEGEEQQEIIADLGLIAAAQRVEHYEISGYGTARTLARQIGERNVAALLAHTLGEEESSDYLLTELAKPLMQQASSGDAKEDAKSVGARRQKA
jgi:manganese catalase